MSTPEHDREDLVEAAGEKRTILELCLKRVKTITENIEQGPTCKRRREILKRRLRSAVRALAECFTDVVCASSSY